MARDPDIRLNVTTDDAVKNLGNLEGAAVDAEGKVEKLDGQTVKLDTTDATRALDNVAKKLDEANSSAKNAGKDGIPVTTNAFKDLTGSIGGGNSGALGKAFEFGESIEGLGDLVEGFGGKLGLSQAQIGKVTTALGTTLGVLGAVGVAFTVGKAAYDAFTAGARNAKEEQEKFNNEVKAAESALKDVTQLMSENKKEEAYRKVIENITDQFDLFSEAGLNVADIVRAIAEGDRKYLKTLSDTEQALYDQGAALEYETEAAYQRGEISDEEYDKRIKTVDALDKQAAKTKEAADYINIQVTANENNARTTDIVREALGLLSTATAEQTELFKKNAEQIEDRRQKQLDAIDTERDLEIALLDTKDAIQQYDDKIAATNGDIDEQRRITIDTAREVEGLAKQWGLLAGPEGSIANVNRTRESLEFLYRDLAPGSPLRTEIQGTINDLAKIGVGYQSGGPITGAALAAKEGGIRSGSTSNTTINVTVTSADPNAVVRALQTYVRQNGALPPNIR